MEFDQCFPARNRFSDMATGGIGLSLIGFVMIYRMRNKSATAASEYQVLLTTTTEFEQV